MVSNLYNIFLPNYAFLQPTSKRVCSAKTHSRLGGQGKSSGKCSAWGTKFKPGLSCTQDNRAGHGAIIRLGTARGACLWGDCSGLRPDSSYLLPISQVIGIDLANSHNYTKLLLIVDGEGAVTLSARKVKKATARKYVTQKGDCFYSKSWVLSYSSAHITQPLSNECPWWAWVLPRKPGSTSHPNNASRETSKS